MENDNNFDHLRSASNEELNSLFKSLAGPAVRYGDMVEVKDADIEHELAYQFQLDLPVELYGRHFHVDRDVETIQSVQLTFKQAHILDGGPVPDTVDLEVNSLLETVGLQVSKTKWYTLYEEGIDSSQQDSYIFTEYSYKDSEYRLNVPSREELEASDDPVRLVLANLSELYSSITKEEAGQLEGLLADIWLHYDKD